MDIASEPGQVATLCQLRPVWRKGRAHSSVIRGQEKNRYVTEVVLSRFICEQATMGDDHHSLAILAPAQEPLASPSRVFSFESQLKPEERRKEVEPKMEAKSTRWGAGQPPSSSSGLAACAGLVWKIPLVEAKHLGKQVPARVGLVGLQGCTASVNSNHTQEQGARFWVSEGVCSHQVAAAHWCRAGVFALGEAKWGWAGTMLPAHAIPWHRLTPPKGSCRCRWPRSCRQRSGASPRTLWH